MIFGENSGSENPEFGRSEIQGFGLKPHSLILRVAWIMQTGDRPRQVSQVRTQSFTELGIEKFNPTGLNRRQQRKRRVARISGAWPPLRNSVGLNSVASVAGLEFRGSDSVSELCDTISQDVVFPRAIEEFRGPSFDRRILNRITLRNANFQRAIRAPDFEPK